MVYCGRCGEDAWFPELCAGGCGRTICEDCAADEGYCPECYRGEPPQKCPTCGGPMAKGVVVTPMMPTEQLS